MTTLDDIAGRDARPKPPQCEVTKPRLDPTLPPKQCPRPAKYGEWCRQHAESLGGWRLAPPDPNHYRELASSFWVYYRCGMVGCRVVEPHEHGGHLSMNAPALTEGSDRT